MSIRSFSGPSLFLLAGLFCWGCGPNEENEPVDMPPGQPELEEPEMPGGEQPDGPPIGEGGGSEGENMDPPGEEPGEMMEMPEVPGGSMGEPEEPVPADSCDPLPDNGHFFSFSAIPFGSEDPELSMCDYRGDVLLIVNTAARCGFTPQYAALQALHDGYGAQGFQVLGFLSNDFGNQGGSKGQVEECETTYGLTFQQFEHVGVTSGSAQGQHEIFGWLTGQPGFEGEVPWNFSKFLIGRDGTLLGRWDHLTLPENSDITGAIESALEETP